MSILNGGQALIQQLAAEGIRVVFGIPGQGQYEAVDALYNHPTIQYISVRNEQAATYMADGYARASGEIAAVLVVQGPGLFNAAAGMATAHAVSAPMLVITGSHHLDRKRGSDRGNAASPFLQELTKWSARAMRPAEIPVLVHEAVNQLRTGRPRPVGLEIAPEVFAAREEAQRIQAAADLSGTDDVSGLDQTTIAQAGQMIAQAEHPVIWAGGGVQRAGAGRWVQALAEQLDAPVVTSRQGKGVISDRHPLSLGFAETRYQPLREWLATRDLILAVGTSTNFSNYPQTVIQIDVDPAQISQGTHVSGIVGDAGRTLPLLHEATLTHDHAARQTTAAVHAEVAALNAARFNPADQLQPQWDFMTAIRRALPDDAVVVQGMNQMGYYSRNYFPVYGERSYLTASALATLGCAFPLALGAKVGQPERVVVALSGDGGFLYNSQELATAVQYGINVIVLLFNDNAYGNVLRAQEEQFDGRVIGTQLHNPNFVQLAQSYGAATWQAKDAAALETALQEAIRLNRPAVIEVPVGKLNRTF
jgi:acetolactate synthase-1/2/3 large subunit